MDRHNTYICKTDNKNKQYIKKEKQEFCCSPKGKEIMRSRLKTQLHSKFKDYLIYIYDTGSKNTKFCFVFLKYRTKLTLKNCNNIIF